MQQILDIQHGFAEELVAALLFYADQAALDRAYAGGRDIAVFSLECRSIVANLLQHGAQILDVEQQQTLIVGDLEYQLQHALLRVIQIQHARQQQRAQIRYRRPHRMAFYPIYIPERDRGARPYRLLHAQHRVTLLDLATRCAGFGDAGQIAFDVGHEDRHADIGQGLREGLQSDGFPGAGGARDAAMAIGKRGQQAEFVVCIFCNQQWIWHVFVYKG